MRYEPEPKKSPPHLLQKFAVCDIPLYNICDYNVSRDRCKELGCCFYKSVCYEKAMPIYVHLSSILLVVIIVALVIALVNKIVQERRKQKEAVEETLPPESSSEPVEESLAPTGGSVSKKSDEGAEEETVKNRL
ncbi:PREDICTED: testis-expressed sequence 29 protein isoform X2 [Chinchilla lanigera]|uniref:testis-expressed sequence 29 protein isoform X2 n=1 Tax=Chinchilla lanigera TaxID=34839 RepID=UPI000698A90A|nr:PREDICTED: testis-expressed sequence 29 protein isoform X2 [Chinchilla lanigera]